MPQRVELISGLLYPTDDVELRERTISRMEYTFGRVARRSDVYPWEWTDYYASIAPRLSRIFVSFESLRDAGELAAWKRAAIALEAESGDGGSRRVNIDPGYADASRLVLASTKDNAQRIYISDGIWAEVTMIRRRSGWEKFSYTFPDFASGAYDGFFDEVRSDWRRLMRVDRQIQD